MTRPLSTSQALAKARRQHIYYSKLQLDLYDLATNGKPWCAVCGYSATAALHLHHPDPSVKTRKFNQRNWSPKDLEDPDFITELRGCVLLCANCHALTHAAEHARRIFP